MQERTEKILQEIAGEVTQNRKRLMWFGILSLVFGIIGTFMSVTLTITSIIFVAIFLMIAGITFFVDSFSAPTWKGKLYSLFIAIVYIAAAAVMIEDPAASAVWFTLFIAAFFVAVGLSRIIMGFRIKDQINEWGWMVFGGILSLVLGLLIFAQWPISGLWVIGLFVSIELIVQGVNSIVFSRIIKRTQEEIHSDLKA